MHRSQTPLLAGAVILGALVTFLYLNRKPKEEPAPPPTEKPAPRVERVKPPEPPEPTPPPMVEMQETEADSPSDPLDALESAGLGARKRNPAVLMNEIGEVAPSQILKSAVGDKPFW